jgi:uncharacterized protein YndB with AHSA1/START domain
VPIAARRRILTLLKGQQRPVAEVADALGLKLPAASKHLRVLRFEFRPGGVWEFTMRGPDGTEYPNRIEWLEILPPERMVFRHGAKADDPEALLSTVTLVDHGPASEVVLRSLFNSRAQRDEVVERYGAVEGGRRTLGRLATYVAAMTQAATRR